MLFSRRSKLMPPVKSAEINIDKYIKQLSEENAKFEKKMEQSFRSALRRLTLAECRTCGQKILVSDGGWYRNSKGQVFCSHECIDNYKEYREDK